jgi:putative transposase
VIPGKYDGEKHVFSGKRLKRGLYKSKDGLLINADVNGGYNICKKAFPNAFVPDGIEGAGLHPKIVVIR